MGAVTWGRGYRRWCWSRQLDAHPSLGFLHWVFKLGFLVDVTAKERSNQSLTVYPSTTHSLCIPANVSAFVFMWPHSSSTLLILLFVCHANLWFDYEGWVSSNICWVNCVLYSIHAVQTQCVNHKPQPVYGRCGGVMHIDGPEALLNSRNKIIIIKKTDCPLSSKRIG